MGRAMDVSYQPTEVRLAEQVEVLRLVFEDGSSFALAADDLPLSSPSVEGKEFASRTDGNCPGVKDVKILAVELVGNYALRMQFDNQNESRI